MNRDMRMHSLKTWPEFFDAIRTGLKTFEFRKNDRGFEVGDNLDLRLWEPGPEFMEGSPEGYGYDGIHKAPSVLVHVTYIVHGGRLGIPNGYCIMGIELLHDE